MKAYYQLLEDTKDNPAWYRKIQDDVGQSLHYLTLTFDESDRNALVAQSELFRKFVYYN